MVTYTPQKTKKPYKSWIKDGVDGGPTSMDILIDWLTIEANYSKWRGDEAERTPKKLLLEDIIAKLNQVGIFHRVSKDVASKLSTLQSNYKTARKWYENEGKTLLQKGVQESAVHNELIKRFPYWDALHTVFSMTRTESTAPWPMSIRYILHSSEDMRTGISTPSLLRSSSEETQDTMDEKDTLQPMLTPSAETTKLMTRFSTFPVIPHGGINKVRRVSSPQLYPYKYDTTDPMGKQQRTLGRKARSQEMLGFIVEKRMEYDRLLVEKEKTRRIRAKADLVKSMVVAGFSRQDITQQLQLL